MKKTMFYEETRKKTLDELGDDIVNLRPTKLTQSLSLDSMIDALYDVFLMALSTGHTKLAIAKPKGLVHRTLGWPFFQFPLPTPPHNHNEEPCQRTARGSC